MIRIQRFRLYDLVAILVILALFYTFWLTHPAPSSGVYYGKMLTCICNLRQLGGAGSLYEGDNAGKRPGPQPQGPHMALASWDRPLAIQMGANITIHAPFDSLTVQPTHPSVKVLQTFTCPKDPQRNGARMVPLVPGSFADGMADGNGICRSYVLNLGSGNSMIGKDDGVSANADAIPVVKIDSGAGTVFLIESHGYATVFGQANIANDTTIVGSRDGIFKPADAFTNPSVVPMHGKKSKPLINALMYDGHVESIESTYLIANGCELMQYIK